MPEPHPHADFDEACRLGRSARVEPDVEALGRPPQQRCVPDRLGRCRQQQSPGLSRERFEPSPKALLDQVRQGRYVGKSKPARQLGRAQSPRHLKQRERVPTRLGHESVAHSFVQASGQCRSQQRAGIIVTEAADHQLRKPGQRAHLAGLTHREHQANRFRQETARDERERQG